jgi:hypothetical protein
MGISTLALRVSDVTGQKVANATSVPPESTIGELLKSLLNRMGLVQQDAFGQPVTYRARLEREGRHLHGSELVQDSLEDGDELVLQPHINAG